MIRGGFLSEEDRNKLIALAREGSVASRVTRRANALVLLDDGWSCQEVADAFLLNDDTIRGWFKLFEQRGIEGLTSFDVGGSASFLSADRRRIQTVVATPGGDRRGARGGLCVPTKHKVSSAVEARCPSCSQVILGKMIDRAPPCSRSSG